MTRRRSEAKEPLPCPFCQTSRLQFTVLKNNGLRVECPTCHASGPPAKGVMFQGVDVAPLDTQTLAIRLWNFRLDARSVRWHPEPRFRCLDCRVNWVASEIGRCNECAQRREAEK